jgi:hypothetical protein
MRVSQDKCQNCVHYCAENDSEIWELDIITEEAPLTADIHMEVVALWIPPTENYKFCIFLYKYFFNCVYLL